MHNYRAFTSLLLLSAVIGSAQQIQNAGPAAVLAAAGAPITLRALVVDENGNPAGGKNVLFIAPDSGPGGEFTRNAGDKQIWAVSADDGTVAVGFIPNALPGPYMVSACLEGSPSAVDFAITNNSTAAPALDPAGALQKVQDLAAGGKVYGPFVLDAGTVLAPSGSEDGIQPLTLTTPNVLFWIDGDPKAGFSHPVQWMMLDAGDPAAVPAPVNRNWAPYVAPPTASDGYELVAPRLQIPEDAILPLQAAKSGSAQHFGDGSNKNACAVILYGPGSAAFENGAADFRSVMSDTLNIPDSNIFENTTPGKVWGVNYHPATRSDLTALLQKAQASGCRKLYFVFVGHGGQGTFSLGKPPDSNIVGDYDQPSYAYLADRLQGTSIPEVSVIVCACHSGSAIPAMQNHKFSGEIVTATDADSCAYYEDSFWSGRYSYWASVFKLAWKVYGADAKLQDVSKAVIDIEQRHEADGKWVVSSNPRAAIIEANGGQASTPKEVVIADLKDSAQNPVTITAQALGYPDDGGEAVINFDDTSIADSTNNPRVAVPAGGKQASFAVSGLKEGHTGYTITFRDKDLKEYTAKGTIRVGNGLSVKPSPVTLHAGTSATVTISRSAEFADQDAVTLTIKAADNNSAAIAAAADATVTIPKLNTSADISIKGLSAGTATFNVTDGKSTVQIQVNVDRVALDRSSLQLKVGEAQVVRVLRMGPVVPYSATPVMTVAAAPGSPANVVSVSPSSFTFTSDVRSFEVSFRGLSPGAVSFIFTDAVEGWTVGLPVTVVGSCPTGGTAALTTSVVSDPFRSAAFVNMPATVNFPFTVANGRISFTAGNVAQMPPGSGTFDSSTCSFSFSTTAPQAIAGFSNVMVGYEGAFVAPLYNSLSMNVQVGLNNTLNNEPQPVTYKAAGPVK